MTTHLCYWQNSVKYKSVVKLSCIFRFKFQKIRTKKAKKKFLITAESQLGLGLTAESKAPILYSTRESNGGILLPKSTKLVVSLLVLGTTRVILLYISTRLLCSWFIYRSIQS